MSIKEAANFLRMPNTKVAALSLWFYSLAEVFDCGLNATPAMGNAQCCET
jgi:hypothetical protein